MDNNNQDLKWTLKTPSPRVKLPACFPQQISNVRMDDHAEQLRIENSRYKGRESETPISEFQQNVFTLQNSYFNRDKLPRHLENHKIYNTNPSFQHKQFSNTSYESRNSIIDKGLKLLDENNRRRKELNKLKCNEINIENSRFPDCFETLISDNLFSDKFRIKTIIDDMIFTTNNVVKKEVSEMTEVSFKRYVSKNNENILKSNKIVNLPKKETTDFLKKPTKSHNRRINCKGSTKPYHQRIHHKPTHLYNQILQTRIKPFSIIQKPTAIVRSVKTQTNSFPVHLKNNKSSLEYFSKFQAIPIGLPKFRPISFKNLNKPQKLEEKIRLADGEKLKTSKLIMQNLPIISIQPNSNKVHNVSSQTFDVISKARQDDKGLQINVTNSIAYEQLSNPQASEYASNVLEQESNQRKIIEENVKKWIGDELFACILMELSQCKNESESIVKNGNKNELVEEIGEISTIQAMTENLIDNDLETSLLKNVIEEKKVDTFNKEQESKVDLLEHMTNINPDVSTSIASLVPSSSLSSLITPESSKIETNEDNFNDLSESVQEIQSSGAKDFEDISLPVTPCPSAEMDPQSDSSSPLEIKTPSFSSENILKLPESLTLSDDYDNIVQQTPVENVNEINTPHLTRDNISQQIECDHSSEQSIVSKGELSNRKQFVSGNDLSLNEENVSSNSTSFSEFVGSEDSKLDSKIVSEGEIVLHDFSRSDPILAVLIKMGQEINSENLHVDYYNDISAGEILYSDEQCVLQNSRHSSLSLGEVIPAGCLINIKRKQKEKLLVLHNEKIESDKQKDSKCIKVDSLSNITKIEKVENKENAELLKYEKAIKVSPPVPKPRQQIKKFTLPSVFVNQHKDFSEENINKILSEKFNPDDSPRINLYNTLKKKKVFTIDNEDNGTLCNTGSDDTSEVVADDTINDVSEISLSEN